jgi:hypothetical protein
LHALLERSDVGLRFRILGRCVHEDANAPGALALLRARRERPRSRHAADKRDELAPSHVSYHAENPAPSGAEVSTTHPGCMGVGIISRNALSPVSL